MTSLTTELQSHWTALGPFLTIRNESEYDSAISLLNELLDEIGDNEQHPLYSLLDTLGTLIDVYEDQYHLIADSSAADMLRFLMQEHDLTQSELPEVGSQSVVSEILSGKRELNVRQIRALAQRFRVSPAVFM